MGAGNYNIHLWLYVRLLGSEDRRQARLSA